MHIYLQNQTAETMKWLMVSSSDHVAGITGKAGLMTVTLRKEGGSFAAPSGGGTIQEVGNGWYQLAAVAADFNTLGDILLHAVVSDASADPCDDKFQVVAYDPRDAVRQGLSALPNAAANAVGGLPVSAAGGSAMTLTSGERDSIADALLKRDWTAVTGEASRSVLNALRLLRNAWTVASGLLHVKKEDDSTDAWTAVTTSDSAAAPITGSDPT